MHIPHLFLVCSMLTAHKTCFPSNSKKSLLSSAPCASGKGSLNVEYLVLKKKNVCSLLWTVPSLKIPNSSSSSSMPKLGDRKYGY